MNEVKYIVVLKTGPKGRQTGYAVKNTETDTEIAQFTNRKYGYWRVARDRAYNQAAWLNQPVS